VGAIADARETIVFNESGIPHVKSSDGVDDASISPDRPRAGTVATDSGSVSSF
jgi:hypothetical protein